MRCVSLHPDAADFGAWLDWINAQARAHDIRLEDGRPVRFVAHDRLPRDAAYEQWIAQTACVPTRNNHHDRLNAFVWLRLPRLKARLNAIQSFWLDRLGAHGPRGAWRDWATLMDENGAIVLDASPHGRLGLALQARRWIQTFVEAREDWREGRQVHLLGHALLEKALAPYKAMTAHAWVLPLPQGAALSSWRAVDAHAQSVCPTAVDTVLLQPPALLPLPILGVPGWWPANEVSDFYADQQVFRPLPAARIMSVDSGSDDRC
ncbi:MAG: hypothetical protein RL133_801 [Pseudomonadota bacterium]